MTGIGWLFLDSWDLLTSYISMASIIEERSVKRINKGISGPAVLVHHVYRMKGLNNTLGFIPCSTHLMDGSSRKARAYFINRSSGFGQDCLELLKRKDGKT